MGDLKLPDINNVELAGKLTRDPELTHLPSGSNVCKFGIAVNRKYKTKDGDQREETLFINVTTWGKTADFLNATLSIGSPVLVEGRLQSSEWEDKQSGQKRSQIEVSAFKVQCLEWSADKQAPKPAAVAPVAHREEIPEDDIPF